MTATDRPARVVSVRLVLLCLAIAALIVVIGFQMRGVFRAGQRDGDRERLKAVALAAERRQAPGPATPAR